MKRHWSSGIAAALVAVAAANGAEARQPHPFRPGSLYGGLHAGGTAFTDMLRTVESGGEGGAAGVRRLSARTTGSGGAAVEFAPSPHWAIRVQGSWTPTRFEVIEPRSAGPLESVSQSDALLARLNVWTADVTCLFHVPIGLGSTALYGVAGAGATEFRARPADDAPVPADAAPEFAAGAVRGAVAVLGAGVRIPLDWRDSRLGFEVTGRVGASPVRRADPDELRHEERLDMMTQLRFQLSLSVPLLSARGLDGASRAAHRSPDP